MRRKKNRSRLLPFGAGLAAGYLLTIGVAAAGALVMWLTGADSSMAWLTAVPAAALGSFLCGRTAGKQRRRGGLKTGAVCGVLYCVPLILAALIFGTVQGILLPVKAALCAGAGIVLFPGELSEAVRGSVGGCLEVVIPALFAFTVLAVYLQRSGLYRVVLKPLTVPLSKLLRLPEELCAVFLLSNIGGYPVGAKLLTGLVRSGRLRRGDASRLLCCCYGSGPSFVIGTAGMQVFGSAAAGGMIFGACILSSLAEAAVVCMFGKPILLDESSSAQDLSAECFISSVDAGARVMYPVCVMSVAFAAVTALLDSAGITELAAWALGKLGLGGNSDRLLPAMLEVTQVRGLVPEGAAASLCAAALSFGGVCVLMQVGALTGGEISMKPLLISRLPVALLSGLLAVPAGKLTAAAEAYSPNASGVPAAGQAFSINAGLSVCVLIMAGMLILLVEGGRATD